MEQEKLKKKCYLQDAEILEYHYLKTHLGNVTEDMDNVNQTRLEKLQRMKIQKDSEEWCDKDIVSIIDWNERHH